jgi:hypothetical protein
MLYTSYLSAPCIEMSRAGWPDGYIAETRSYTIIEDGVATVYNVKCRRRRRSYQYIGMTESAAIADAITIQATLTASAGVLGLGGWDGTVVTQTVSTGTATAERMQGSAWRIAVEIDYDSWEIIT